MKQLLPFHAGMLLALVVLAGSFSACKSKQSGSEAEPASGQEGWLDLTGGPVLEGWRGFGQQDIPANWTYADGVLAANGGGPSLITADQYGDFDLELEWKISKCGNSGIFYHVSEDYNRPQHTGPEYQLLDETCHPAAQRGDSYLSGANYALHGPADRAAYDRLLKPAGAWNQARIVVRGQHVEHWLNGTKIVEYELGSDDWKARYDTTKFAEWPEYGRRLVGHIALQDHGDPVWFRNIRISTLR